MSSLKATPQLSQICARLPVQAGSQAYLQAVNDAAVPLQEDALEQRWERRQSGAPAPQGAPVPNPQTHLALQLDRARVACQSARLNSTTAKGRDKVLLHAMATCKEDIVRLAEECSSLCHLPDEDPVWPPLLDQAYTLGKALDSAMQRLALPLCSSISMDMLERTRGQLGHHELYALAALLEHVEGHDLPCAEVRKLLHSAHQRSLKAQQANLSAQLSTDDKATLRDFAAHPMVNKVLEDAHRMQTLETKAQRSKEPEYAMTPAARSHRTTMGNAATTAATKAIDQALQTVRSARDAILMQASAFADFAKLKEVEDFLRSHNGRDLSKAWDAAGKAFAELAVQPQDRARYLEDHSLRTQLTSMANSTEICELSQMFQGRGFYVPETLRTTISALRDQANKHVISPNMRSALRALNKEIATIYRDATDANSIAMELAYVLDTRVQETLRGLSQRLSALASDVDKRPLLRSLKHRRAKSVPLSKSGTSPSAHEAQPTPSLKAKSQPELSTPAFDSDDEFDDLDDFEQAPEAAMAALMPPSPKSPQATSVGAPGANDEAPLRTLRVNGRGTALRTRLTNGQALALINSQVDKGTFSSPLSSAIYHYRRHVLCEVGHQPADAKPRPDVSIEDYLAAAQQRFAQWDGHTVTHSLGTGELLALVEERPRGWFTRDGKVVSFCYEDA